LIAFPALAVLPPGVTKKPVPAHPDITLYERPVAATLPSFWESFYNLFRLPSATKLELPFQRSVAVLVGIGHYQYITPKLEYVSKDVEKMRDYLLGDGGFDAAYVMDEGVSPETVNAFMSDELPQSLKPDDRLLFYYSGHGADPGSGRPVLQFRQARPGQWGQNVLRVDEYEQWSLVKIKHVLFLYDACTAGEAVMPKEGKAETRAAVSELSGNGSRMVVTAGTAKQQAWVVKESSDNQYSIFTEALVRALRDGTAESKRRGFITIGQAVEEAEVILADMTRHLGPGHEMNPDPVKIDRSRTGTFVFLNPHANRPTIPQGDILAMGMTVPKGALDANLEKERELAYWRSIDLLDDPQLYERVCEEFPAGLFCPAARKRIERLQAGQASVVQPGQDLTKLSIAELRRLADEGSRDALTQMGRVYESGLQGVSQDLQASIEFYRHASDLGDAEASYRIAKIYDSGRKGLPADQVQAAGWYRKAAEAGNAAAMNNLGVMCGKGVGGLPKDPVQKVSWFRKAADAGSTAAMTNLGLEYATGKGVLEKDSVQAVSWFRKAAEAGNATAMAELGTMYAYGRGGLPTDDVQALACYRKAAEAGDASGMTKLGVMYANGRGGLRKDDKQAVTWYRKAAEAGEPHAMDLLANAYEDGQGGLRKDKEQALNWRLKAAHADP
jgi:TPR repeat protein